MTYVFEHPTMLVTMRVYRHIVAKDVWTKVLAFCDYAKPSFKKDWIYLDYPVGSVLEGNLVHWIANSKKR